MTVFHNRKNAIALPCLPPPLRKTSKSPKLFPGRHTNNSFLRRRSRYPFPFQIRNTNSGHLFGSPSSPTSSTEIINPLLLLPPLQDNKSGFEITCRLARLSLCDLPSSCSPPANAPSTSNNVTQTPFIGFLDRLQQGTEPTFDRGEKHKDYIQIPVEYLLHPRTPLGSTIQAYFFDQCYPDSSMYGTHIILTKFIREADMYNSVGFNKLPSTSDTETYWSDLKDTPKRYDPVLRNFLTLPPPLGRPPHCLKLKVGLPIMLLKKVGGVCAGTLLIVEKLEKHVITAREAVAVGGCGGGRGGRVIRIRRQDYEESTGVEPILSYKRKQFPVKRAFALVVDDLPEGVMFEGVGLDLTYDMTSPGQLHSALSRCRDPSKLKVYIPKAWAGGASEQYTRNVLRVDKK